MQTQSVIGLPSHFWSAGCTVLAFSSYVKWLDMTMKLINFIPFPYDDELYLKNGSKILQTSKVAKKGAQVVLKAP